eukprot:TRINITY_DN6036_c0_g1_i5.p1 TRINITY_DN6036_c0_g1~~TRINITY_DN6036_c0_g1_i5.p1  ORF type:complete len:526 (+),score=103.16 TRINITY_DN6036_c0_g1_i5:17-1594(+)
MLEAVVSTQSTGVNFRRATGMFLFFIFFFLVSSSGLPGEDRIKHVITFMLENRAFDHMLGYLHKINPEINGLRGNEFNLFDPNDPSSGSVTVSFDAPYQTLQDCGHSVDETRIELWGSERRVDPATMNGFVLNEVKRAGKDNANIVMRSFNTSTLPVLSQLALQYALFDSYYSSLPGPTLPNRMYFISGTSHGACENDAMPEIKGYPQRTFFEDVYDSGKEFKIYFGDFPSSLGLSRLREYPLHFHTMDAFFDDASSGSLPAYAYIEPRWFDFLEWMENSQHPGKIEFVRSGDVRYGEMLLKSIYEAIRASPAWNQTLLVVTYDEHGGLYDHVPPPQMGVPSPDGINCTTTPFDFQRLGIRVPAILISPWVKKGRVIHEPTLSHYDHTSVLGTARKLLHLHQGPLTEREKWAATFEDFLYELDEPRVDCPLSVDTAQDEESKNMWKTFSRIEKMPQNEENIQLFMKNGIYDHMRMPTSEWQKQILNIAHGLALDQDDDFTSISTTHEAALFVRRQMKLFLSKKEK